MVPRYSHVVVAVDCGLSDGVLHMFFFLLSVMVVVVLVLCCQKAGGGYIYSICR